MFRQNLPTLIASTGSDAADEAVRALLGRLEDAFPGRLRSCYVEGSYADGSAVATSDIDLTIVFKERFAGAEEREQATRLVADCATRSPVELDIDLTDEAGLAGGVYPALKEAGRCLYGEDQRARMLLLPLDEWTRQRMHAAYVLLVHIFARPRVVSYPLSYPDPVDPFFGYARRKVRLDDGELAPSTRDLARVMSWIGTALLAYRAGVYVARKSACHQAYRLHIGDEWAPLLEETYRRCRTQWRYLLPAGADDRRALRALCERTLQFENHYLSIYRVYLLEQLSADGVEAPRAALWALEQAIFRDVEVRRAVLLLDAHADAEIRQAARRLPPYIT